MKQNKERQYEITSQLEQYTEADESYHVTASTVFSLADRASEIFESSEPKEKHQLLQYLLQNCEFDGKNLVYTMKAPYETMLSLSDDTKWLRGRDVIRTKLEVIFLEMREYYASC